MAEVFAVDGAFEEGVAQLIPPYPIEKTGGEVAAVGAVVVIVDEVEVGRKEMGSDTAGLGEVVLEFVGVTGLLGGRGKGCGFDQLEGRWWFLNGEVIEVGEGWLEPKEVVAVFFGEIMEGFPNVSSLNAGKFNEKIQHIATAVAKIHPDILGGIDIEAGDGLPAEGRKVNEFRAAFTASDGLVAEQGEDLGEGDGLGLRGVHGVKVGISILLLRSHRRGLTPVCSLKT